MIMTKEQFLVETLKRIKYLSLHVEYNDDSEDAVTRLRDSMFEVMQLSTKCFNTLELLEMLSNSNVEENA